MEKTELLNSIKSQSKNFDDKASTLLTVVGFIIAFTTSFIGLFDKYKGTNPLPVDKLYKTLLIFVIIYFSTLVISAVFFVSVIFPRKRDKKIPASPNYYMDIAKRGTRDNSTKEPLDEDLETQILMNSIICTKKHEHFVFGIGFLSLSTISLLVILIFSLFY